MAEPKQLLFLCTGNYYRSRFAELWFNYRAPHVGLDWRATSRGLALVPEHNSGCISQFTRARLAERGVTLEEPVRFPEASTAEDLRQAERIIAMKRTEHEPLLRVRFPDDHLRVEYWQIDDVDCELPSAALEKLERQVESLIVELAGLRSAVR